MGAGREGGGGGGGGGEAEEAEVTEVTEETEETEKGMGGELWDWNLAGRWDGTPASWVEQGCCWEKCGEG